MVEGIINILIFNDNSDEVSQLKLCIDQPGHNILHANNNDEAKEILNRIKIAIIFYSSELTDIKSRNFIEQTSENSNLKDSFIIVTGSEQKKASKLVSGLNKGAVDFIVSPFIKNIISAKIGVFKRLYLKNIRTLNLLENILPEDVIKEFRTRNKYTPKKHNNCAILFADFVNFSLKAINHSPKKLIEILDYYFSNFDQIIQKYQLEKIKTIGDCYMAVGGLTESPHTELQTALAAIEIKEFMIKDSAKRKERNQDVWQIRIGIHNGDLIAGVIGTHKFSFDVWGDSVNIAARCQEQAQPSQITVTSSFYQKIKDYINGNLIGDIPVKNRGEISMHNLESIKEKFTSKEQHLATTALRKIAQLPAIDFIGIRRYIIKRLKNELSNKLTYHSIKHTLIVEKAVIKYGELEGLNNHDLTLTRTAALFHDAGFIQQYENNEKVGVEIFKTVAKDFGFEEFEIKKVEEIILSTIVEVEPKNICEKIMCDADLDYLGRKDYHVTANNLRLEMENYGEILDDQSWLKAQLDYLEKTHQYYTIAAVNIRKKGKEKRISELKKNN